MFVGVFLFTACFPRLSPEPTTPHYRFTTKCNSKPRYTSSFQTCVSSPSEVFSPSTSDCFCDHERQTSGETADVDKLLVILVLFNRLTFSLSAVQSKLPHQLLRVWLTTTQLLEVKGQRKVTTFLKQTYLCNKSLYFYLSLWLVGSFWLLKPTAEWYSFAPHAQRECFAHLTEKKRRNSAFVHGYKTSGAHDKTLGLGCVALKVTYLLSRLFIDCLQVLIWWYALTICASKVIVLCTGQRGWSCILGILDQSRLKKKKKGKGVERVTLLSSEPGCWCW